MSKLEKLQEILREIGPSVIAFSGGCDSSFLLRVAHDVLGDKVVALTAVSPTIPSWEIEEAKEIAQLIGVPHLLVETHETELEEYQKNPPHRCFICKSAFFEVAFREAQRLGFEVVMDGSNFDDLAHYRPGRLALEKFNVRSPLEEAEMTKEDIRRYSQELGLPTWDKVATPCMATRFPYGTRITKERIERLIRYEAFIRSLGFQHFRARYHDNIVRLEFSADEMSKAMQADIRVQLVEQGKRNGFLYIALDMEGYRSGSLDEVLTQKSR